MFSSVWFGVCQLFGISAAFQKEERLHLKQFGVLINSGRVLSLHGSVIWFVCVWCNWKAMNGKCFHNKDTDIEKNGLGSEGFILEMAEI